jgi:hypothetical protein
LSETHVANSNNNLDRNYFEFVTTIESKRSVKNTYKLQHFFLSEIHMESTV